MGREGHSEGKLRPQPRDPTGSDPHVSREALSQLPPPPEPWWSREEQGGAGGVEKLACCSSSRRIWHGLGVGVECHGAHPVPHPRPSSPAPNREGARPCPPASPSMHPAPGAPGRRGASSLHSRERGETTCAPRQGRRSRTHDPAPPSRGDNINTQDPGPALVPACISAGGDPHSCKY